MTVTVLRKRYDDTILVNTTVDSTLLEVPPHLSREAVLADIDALKFQAPNPIPMPPTLPDNTWNGTCSPVHLTAGLADIRAYIAALPARSGVV